MIKVRRIGVIDCGTLTTAYVGTNRKIFHSPDELTHQNVRFKDKFLTNGGELNRLCFEFKLLNRTFMMALDFERLYEVIGDGKDKIYIRLTESRFYIIGRFEKDRRIVFKIKLMLLYEYTPEAAYIEEFKLQYSMFNDEDVIKMFENMRCSDDEGDEELN